MERNNFKGEAGFELLNNQRSSARTQQMWHHDQQDRISFLRKVYTILSFQLCFTTVSIAVVKSKPELNEAMHDLWMLAILALIISFIIEIAILCFHNCARKVPTNYLLLLIFTMCNSFFSSWVASYFSSQSVLVASGMTLVVTIALNLYAYKTKRDFAISHSLLILISIALLSIMIVSVLFTFTFWTFLSAIFVVVYGLYLVYDTKQLAGGKSHSLGYDDYIVGALLLYVDILMLFLELLRLCGSKK